MKLWTEMFNTLHCMELRTAASEFEHRLHDVTDIVPRIDGLWAADRVKMFHLSRLL